MAASWAKNEVTAAKRRCDLLVRYLAADGMLTPAPPSTDFIAAGAVFISGTASPKYALALGTMTNKRRPLVVADLTFTAASGTDLLTATAHGLETGDGPIRVSNSGGALPTGLAAATDYWVIKVSADTFKLATSLTNAYAGTAIDITADGSGTQTLSDTASTERGIWGEFVYEATQAETNHDAPETAVIVDGTVSSLDFRRMNTAGAYTTVTMISSASDWGSVELENGITRDDAMRIKLRTLAAKFSKTGNDYVYRDMADTKDSHHGTVTGAGRIDAAIDDAT